MNKTEYVPSGRIKQKSPFFVKGTLLIALIFILIPLLAGGEPEEEEPSSSTTATTSTPTAPTEPVEPKEADTADLPAEPAAQPDTQPATPIPVAKPLDEYTTEIEARTFEVTSAKRSKSQNVYLFNVTSGDNTKVGKILLLRRGINGPKAMAFRALRTYKDKRFAGRQVRKYENTDVIDAGESFRAIEKVRDIADLRTPEQKAADIKDIDEIEEEVKKEEGQKPEVLQFDPDLDTSADKNKDKSGKPAIMENDPELDSTTKDGAPTEEPPTEEDISSITVEEIEPLDTNTHWLTGQFAYTKNYTPAGESAHYTAFGARYGLTLGTMVFQDTKKVQDSFVLEGSVFLYKIIDYNEDKKDAYTIMPFGTTLRYNILVGQDFSPFFYIGFVKNFVLAAFQATDEDIKRLSSTLFALGTGLTFRVGPSWHFRFDLGLDMIGAGIMLRF